MLDPPLSVVKCSLMVCLIASCIEPTDCSDKCSVVYTDKCFVYNLSCVWNEAIRTKECATTPHLVRRNDGISKEIETELRIYGCEIIQEGGILLRMPQAVMATAQVLLQRFYCKESLLKYNIKVSRSDPCLMP